MRAVQGMKGEKEREDEGEKGRRREGAKTKTKKREHKENEARRKGLGSNMGRRGRTRYMDMQYWLPMQYYQRGDII